MKTDIADIIFEQRKETNPCSLCAKMRKGALNERLKNWDVNKVAYGHHKDDVVETLLLSMIFEGRLHCFAPVTYLDRMDLTVIRPLLYVNEADIIGFKNKMELPVAKSPCPMDGYTKREYAKDLVKQLNQDHPGAKRTDFPGNRKRQHQRLGKKIKKCKPQVFLIYLRFFVFYSVGEVYKDSLIYTRNTDFKL